MLNGMGTWSLKKQKAYPLKIEHLEHAKKVLSKFDIVIILEIKESFQQLKRFSTKHRMEHSHQGHRKKPRNIPDSIQLEFKKLNNWDYQLYDYVCQQFSQKRNNMNKKRCHLN